jgi:hypothetical protein
MIRFEAAEELDDLETVSEQRLSRLVTFENIGIYRRGQAPDSTGDARFQTPSRMAGSAPNLSISRNPRRMPESHDNQPLASIESCRRDRNNL